MAGTFTHSFVCACSTQIYIKSTQRHNYKINPTKQQVGRWLDELRQNASSVADKMVIMLVGNKCDREAR